ncbi:MAG: PQQ-dependent sugar dehydrogenase [Acidobacteriota bacterium]
MARYRVYRGNCVARRSSTEEKAGGRIGWMLAAALLLTFAGLGAEAQISAATEVAAQGGFDGAIGVTHAGDGSGRLFILQLDGVIRIWDGTEVLSTPFLDIESLVLSGGEQGLLGLAFHPSYGSNGYFYVNYTNLGGDTQIVRYSVSAADPDVADPASARPVLSFVQPASNHNGGDLHFGPDGYLMISSGDGGFDWANGQDDSTLLGKLLRIDVDGDDFPADAARNYSIPAGNPLIGVAGAAEEIWSMGLRNPWRFSFDRQTGDLFIGDVGEGGFEEVNFAPAADAGTNFGWPCFEGDQVFDSTAPGCGGNPVFDLPILELAHGAPPDNNCSIIGGYRYRGTDFPDLRGVYFYKDWCTGKLWAGTESGGSWTAELVETLPGFNYTGFGESDTGELYLAGGSTLLRIVDPTAAADLIFRDGFESGTVSAWSSAVP